MEQESGYKTGGHFEKLVVLFNIVANRLIIVCR